MAQPAVPGHVCIVFGSEAEVDVSRYITSETGVTIAECPDKVAAAKSRVKPLSRYIRTGEKDLALDILKALNQLRDENGGPMRSVVTCGDYEPWWFHQERIYNYYLIPFARYESLLNSISQCGSVTVINCPPDLRRILPFCFPGGQPSFEFHRTSRERRSNGRRNASLGRIKVLVRYLFELLLTLLSLAPALVLRHTVLFYAVDVVSPGKRWDIRLDSVYTHLRDSNARLLEVFWTSPDRPVFTNARARRRTGIYLECLWALASLLLKLRWLGPIPQVRSKTCQTVRERFLWELVRNQLLPACLSSVFVAGTIERMVRLVRPRALVAIDDHRHMYETVVACKRQNVMTLAVQHGQVNRHSVGLMGHGCDASLHHGVDEYYLWSDFFRLLVLRISNLYTSSQVRVGGFPRLPGPDDAHRPGLAQADSRDRIAVLFISESYDAVVRKREVEPYLSRLAAEPSIQLLLKLKPAQRDVPYDCIRFASSPVKVMDGTIWAALDNADVVVGSYSSALFDAVLVEKPIVLFATSSYTDPHGLAHSGVAAIASSPDELVVEIRRAGQLGRSQLATRKELVWGRELLDGGATVAARLAAGSGRRHG